MCSFAGFADYQYAATAEGGGEACVGPYGAESEPLLLVPPAFSQREQPVDYAFRNFRAADARPPDGAAAPGASLPATGGRLLIGGPPSPDPLSDPHSVPIP